MTKTLLRAGALSCALLTSTFLTAPAMAQSEPAYRNLDANGVDLTHGDYRVTFTEASLGAGETELALIRAAGGQESFSTWDRLTFRRVHTISSFIYFVGNSLRSDSFHSSGVSLQANGATLTSGSGGYVHQAADGTVTVFSNPTSSSSSGGGLCGSTTPSGSVCYLPPSSITDPAGRTVTLQWTVHSPSSSANYLRLSRVTNSFGYSITFAYANNSPGSGAPPSDWFVRTGATLKNGTTTVGTVSYAAVTGATEVTDMAGRVWRIAGDGNSVTAIRRPGASNDSLAISTSGGTITAVRDGVTTSYSRSLNATTNVATMTVTDANSAQTTIVSDMNIGRPTSVTDPLNRTTGYQYDSNGRLTRVTRPIGDATAYTYDARGNVTETRYVSAFSGWPDLVATASFDSSCANPVTCNQPNSVTDARGNITDYTYDSTHGGVLTVTSPAPTSGADRPQTRYSYTLTNGEYRLTGVTACASGTASSCVGTANETRTVIAYDGNGNMNSIEQRDGSGALSATTTVTYTPLGDVETVNGPLSGTGDTTRIRYNAARQRIGLIGPDPDGSGSLRHRATRTVYGSDGLPTAVQQGSVASQSDADWASFSPAEEVQQGYDANGRPVVQRLVSGSTTHALTQTSYDALGRPECVAQRMNPNEFAPSSLPSSACTLDTEGSYGPDRIARTIYDAAGQVVQRRAAVGTSAESSNTFGYTVNGEPYYAIDGAGHFTYFYRDGHGRPSYTFYPSTTQPNAFDDSTPANAVATAGAVNWSDYELLLYDANGNVTSRQLRDGNSIAYGYDALGRQIQLTRPGSEPGTTFAYDNLGWMTSATSAGLTQSMGYDALGRMTTQVNAVGGDYHYLTSAYDLAGRRTRLDYGNSLYVDYDYLVTGEVSAIRENGATSGLGVLATYSYDDLGRRTGITRGNGTTTSYGYDPVSRLSQLEHQLSGTAYDLTIGSIAYNPAGQIAGLQRSNNAYAYTERANGSVTDTINGLNQVTQTGSASPAHDARGNITDIAGTSYGYRSDNVMTSVGGVTFGYDPLLRLMSYTNAGTTTQFGYDGQNLVAEYNPATVPGTGGIAPALRRYVHGPGTDEPLVWYEGSGTSTRRWFHADERGSLVAVSDESGAIHHTMAYDEYGRPLSTNTARFQYTGQPYIREVGLSYYRARMYNPTLGRFMQTDPIGYGGGLNLYAYVGGDPVNRTDPTGLCNAADTEHDLPSDCDQPEDEIVVRGRPVIRPNPDDHLLDDRRQSVSDRPAPNGRERADDGAIVVRGQRPRRRPQSKAPRPAPSSSQCPNGGAESGTFYCSSPTRRTSRDPNRDRREDPNVTEEERQRQCRSAANTSDTTLSAGAAAFFLGFFVPPVVSRTIGAEILAVNLLNRVTISRYNCR